VHIVMAVLCDLWCWDEMYAAERLDLDRAGEEVEAVVANSHTTCQQCDQADHQHVRVGTGRAGQQVRQVHNDAHQRREVSEDAQDERNADQQFAERHHVAQCGRIGQQYIADQIRPLSSFLVRHSFEKRFSIASAQLA
jgi:hypothetical protein